MFKGFIIIISYIVCLISRTVPPLYSGSSPFQILRKVNQLMNNFQIKKEEFAISGRKSARHLCDLETLN